MKHRARRLKTAIALAVVGAICLGVAMAWREHLFAETTIVALGDSVTRGARKGVKPHDAYSYLLQTELRNRDADVRVVNLGVPGERTDQGSVRFDRDVLGRRPRIVTIMYGTNDSFIYPGTTVSDLSIDRFKANLKEMIVRSLAAGVVPILLTAPRWGDKADPDGSGNNPNVSLERFAQACHEVAEGTHIRLVDVYDRWQKAAAAGADIDAWTTDHCHPNARGHREITEQLLPVVLDALRELPRRR